MNPTALSTHRFAVRRSRAGYAMVEVILAFAVFGIALAGLFPFVLTQLKLTPSWRPGSREMSCSNYMDVARLTAIRSIPTVSTPP